MKFPLAAYFAPLEWDLSRSYDEEDRKWRRKLRATFQYEVLRDPPDRIAAFFGVARRTIERWRSEVLASDRPEVEGLRRLIEDMEK